MKQFIKKLEDRDLNIPLFLLGIVTLILVFSLSHTVLAADSFTVPTQALRGTAPISQDLIVTNQNNTPGLTIKKSSAAVTNLLEIWHNGSLKTAIPTNGFVPIAYGGTGTGTVAGAKSNLGLQGGEVITATDGTVTNVFARSYSSAPTVVSVQVGNDTTITNVLQVTASQFILNTHKAAQTNKWFAIGPP